MDEPEVGTTYKLSDTGGIGQGFGAIATDTKVEVTDVLDPGTLGVGDHTEKVVRIEFNEPGQGINDDGAPLNVDVRRAFSLSLSEFKDKFESVN